jgi:hypothetical protein
VIDRDIEAAARLRIKETIETSEFHFGFMNDIFDAGVSQL